MISTVSSAYGRSDDAGILDGIRVTELCQYIAGPGAAMILRDLGAEVTKVEPPAGEAARHIGLGGEAMIRAYNRGKRSVTLDLRSAEGIEALQRLISCSDVFIHNLRPGALEGLGFTPERIRELNPGVIDVSITGYGQRGPSRSHVGYDIAAQAESGMMSVTGPADADPQRVGFAVVDAAAAHASAEAVLAALLRRHRTGLGARVDVSLLDVALQLQASIWDHYLWTGMEPRRRGNGQQHAAPAADVVATQDGHVVISAYKAEHWQRLCKVLDRPELACDSRFGTNEARVLNRPSLIAELSSSLSGMTSEAVVALMGRNDIVAAVVRGFEAATRNPDVRLSAVFGKHQVGQPDSYRPMLLPYTISGVRTGDSSPAPSPGQHTAAVLSELDRVLPHSATESSA